MAGLHRLLVIVIAFLLLSGSSSFVMSPAADGLQPRISQAFSQIRRAEKAGATSEELGELLELLNTALKLNDQILELDRPEDKQRRAELQTQLDGIVNIVQAKASQLEAVAFQRTTTNRIVAYVFGGLASIVGTLAYAYGISFWHRYRIKRTFQMKVIPK